MNACAAIAVCEAQDVKFNGFGQDSVKVSWWTDYLYWGYRSPQSSEEPLKREYCDIRIKCHF